MWRGISSSRRTDRRGQAAGYAGGVPVAHRPSAAPRLRRRDRLPPSKLNCLPEHGQQLHEHLRPQGDGNPGPAAGGAHADRASWTPLLAREPETGTFRYAWNPGLQAVGGYRTGVERAHNHRPRMNRTAQTIRIESAPGKHGQCAYQAAACPLTSTLRCGLVDHADCPRARRPAVVCPGAKLACARLLPRSTGTSRAVPCLVEQDHTAAQVADSCCLVDNGSGRVRAAGKVRASLKGVVDCLPDDLAVIDDV